MDCHRQSRWSPHLHALYWRRKEAVKENASCLFQDAAKSGGNRSSRSRIYSRGPVYTGGRQINEPGSKQSQLPRICLRPLEFNLNTRRAEPATSPPKPLRAVRQGGAYVYSFADVRNLPKCASHPSSRARVSPNASAPSGNPAWVKSSLVPLRLC